MRDDQTRELCEAVRRAAHTGTRLRIAGSGSKSFLARGFEDVCEEQPERPSALLSLAEHQGIIDYRPEELVLTARAGTPLREVERLLRRSGQHLPFEPPRFRGGGTLGGAVACGLAGPGRPWRGAVRDAVLGVEMINGRGEHLRFGGQVMKNVAGYDIARLQAGAFGTLGVLLSISVKVMPLPVAETTRVFELSSLDALALCRSWTRRPLPLSGTCWWQGRLWVRLSGAEPAVRQAAGELGGDAEPDTSFWERLRDHRLTPFTEPGVWRCSVPPGARTPREGCLVNWAGGERWWCPADGNDATRMLSKAGGHGRPFDGTFGVRGGPHVNALERKYACRLKAAFDPDGILNPELSPTLESCVAD